MARTKTSDRKRSFSTRISPRTLDQLDQLVRSGRYANRTAAIEAAVDRLANDEAEVLERRRRALEASCGAFSLGIDSSRMREAKMEYLEWLADRATGRRSAGG